jgi:hypothetical protein
MRHGRPVLRRLQQTCDRRRPWRCPATYRGVQLWHSGGSGGGYTWCEHGRLGEGPIRQQESHASEWLVTRATVGPAKRKPVCTQQ